MIETRSIEGTPFVMAPYYNAKTLIRGQRVYVRPLYVKLEGVLLLQTRQGIVGLIVPTIFTKEQITVHEPKLGSLMTIGSRVAYAADISEALDQADKHEEAAHLRMEFKRSNGSDWTYMFWMFESGGYEVLRRN